MRSSASSLRRRVLVPFLLLITTVLIALILPLGYARALAGYHRFAIGQLTDCEHLAWIASGVGSRGTGFNYPPDPHYVLAEFERSAERGETIMLVDRSQRVLLSTQPYPRRNLGLHISDRITKALNGFANSDDTDQVSKLLRAEPFVAAHPVRDSHSVVGAVVLIAPTSALRTSSGIWLLPLVAIAMAALIAAVAIALPLSRWMLRPIANLLASVSALSDGDFSSRVVDDNGPLEARELSAAFNTMAERVRIALSVQRTFVADASHQLRNPLTALRMRVEGLAPFIPAEQHSRLELAVAEVQHLSQVLDQLLELAHAEGRKLPTHPQPTRAIIAGRLHAWNEIAGRRSVALEQSGPDSWVLAPPGVLGQVLDVLLDNAVRFAPRGSTVRILVSDRQARILIDVIDGGPGMPDTDKARATDRFWRGASQSDHRGSGLGLAIAASLVATADGVFSLHDGHPTGLIARIDLAGAGQPARPAPL